MKKPISVLLLSLGLLLSGCVSVPMAPPEEDARAKTFEVAPGTANIYVYRNESMGGAIGMEVYLDGALAGKTGPKTYFLFTVEPGSHEIKSKAENESVLTVDAVAGQNHFIWQEVKFGALYARSKLQEVSDEEGRAGVNECKLAASNI